MQSLMCIPSFVTDALVGKSIRQFTRCLHRYSYSANVYVRSLPNGYVMRI